MPNIIILSYSLYTDKTQLHIKKGEGRPITCHEDPEVVERYSSALSLTSALDGRGWSTPRRSRLTTAKETRYPGYPVGSRAGLDGCGKSLPHRDSIPGPSNP